MLKRRPAEKMKVVLDLVYLLCLIQIMDFPVFAQNTAKNVKNRQISPSFVMLVRRNAWIDIFYNQKTSRLCSNKDRLKRDNRGQVWTLLKSVLTNLC